MKNLLKGKNCDYMSTNTSTGNSKGHKETCFLYVLKGNSDIYSKN